MSASERRPRPHSRVVKFALSLAYVVLVFAAAGTVRWPAFWVLLGFYNLTTGAWMLWLRRRDPGLFKERMTGGSRPDIKNWDRAIIRLYSTLLAVMLLVVALDAARFGWSRVPLACQGLALQGLFAAWGLVIWTFRVNAFLAEYVRIQSERGHAVYATGPYRIVRHPMYVAVIVTSLLVPVLLGSLYALILSGLIAALFVLRTALEDRTLREELAGYEEYARAVRWKLVPGLW